MAPSTKEADSVIFEERLFYSVYSVKTLEKKGVETFKVTIHLIKFLNSFKSQASQRASINLTKSYSKCSPFPQFEQ